MIEGTPWRVSAEGADAVDAAVIVDNKGGEVLGVSEWARIDDKPLADIVRAVNAHDALVAALEAASGHTSAALCSKGTNALSPRQRQGW